MTPEHRPRILIIDDDEPFRGMMADLLSPKGYEVVVAHDGVEGFRRATRERFDVITVDIKMPELNGVEALRSMQIVRNPAKLIVISGYLTDEIADDCRAAGASAVLSKPVDSELLDGTLKSLLHDQPLTGDNCG